MSKCTISIKKKKNNNKAVNISREKLISDKIVELYRPHYYKCAMQSDVLQMNYTEEDRENWWKYLNRIDIFS